MGGIELGFEIAIGIALFCVALTIVGVVIAGFFGLIGWLFSETKTGLTSGPWQPQPHSAPSPSTDPLSRWLDRVFEPVSRWVDRQEDKLAKKLRWLTKPIKFRK